MNEISTLPLGHKGGKRAYVYSGFSEPNHKMLGSNRDDVYSVYSPPKATNSVGRKVYNTGKVLIGSAYEPPRRAVFSRQEELLQRALLDQSPSSRHEWHDIALYILAVIAVIVVTLTA